MIVKSFIYSKYRSSPRIYKKALTTRVVAVIVTRVTTIIGISLRNMVIALNLIIPSFLFYFAKIIIVFQNIIPSKIIIDI